MAQFKVLSERCALGKVGATVTIEEESGVNVEALISAGHIAPVAAKPIAKEADNKEN
jgi:hypothetical protein